MSEAPLEPRWLVESGWSDFAIVCREVNAFISQPAQFFVRDREIQLHLLQPLSAIVLILLLTWFSLFRDTSEWWITRRGMAFGLISSASGLTGIFMPLLLEILLSRYGYRVTLRACAVTMTILTAPLLPILKGRLPLSEAGQRPKTSFTFAKRPLFWCYALAIIIQGFGFFFPSIFLPSYAIGIGMSSKSAAALLAVMATAATLGQFILGWLSDQKISVDVLTSLCYAAAAIATATLWGLGNSFALLVLYSIIYGFFAFDFGTLRVAMGRAVSTDESAVLATFSTFVFMQGVGNIMTGPISARLNQGAFDQHVYGAGRYKSTIIFVATSSMLAAVVIAMPRTWKLLTV